MRRITIGFGFTPDRMKKWRAVFEANRIAYRDVRSITSQHSFENHSKVCIEQSVQPQLSLNRTR